MNKYLIRTEQFPVTRNLVYMNHASVGPLSSAAAGAMEEFVREQRDFGALHWRDWGEEYRETRHAAAALLGCDASEISLLKNTTEGLSFVAAGLDWRDGDNVVTTDMEFPSNWLPWKNLERRGVACREITTRDGAFTTSDVEALIDDRTRLVALSAVAFHNGFRPDLEAIGELCASRGVLFCVDAIQAVGAIDVDVETIRASFLAADAHKWLCGPEAAAIFYCRAELRERLDVLEPGWMSIDRGGKMIGAGFELYDDGRRFEGGSLNTTGISGLRAALQLVNTIGIAEIERELLAVAGHLADELLALGLEVASPRPLSSGIVAIRPPKEWNRQKVGDALGATTATQADERSDERRDLYRLHAWLEKNRIVCSPREGMLRFSPHFYNDANDIDHVIDALEEIL